MILTRDEAICLVLSLSAKHEISSITKLNKLLARLNLHCIPIDMDFSLNQYGSFDAHLQELESNELFEERTYSYMNRNVKGYHLLPKGQKFVDDEVRPKLMTMLTQEDFQALTNEIHELSTLKASEISGDEHKKLFLDVDDRHKLTQLVNTVAAEITELYKNLDSIKANSGADIRLKALIEYCYHLINHIKQRFKRLEERYDFDAYMYDYYFLYHINTLLPFMKEQMRAKDKDARKINKYYQYIVNSVKDRYPFSPDNKDLSALIIDGN